MPKQIGNLEVPKLFETWDNPLWVGEEADKYRNVVKDYGETYDSSLEHLWQIEYRKLEDIPEIILTSDRDELIEHCESKIKRCMDRYSEFGEEWIEKHCGIYNKILEVLR